MTLFQKLGLFFLSLFIVGFGQPAWIPFLAPLSGAFGFALLFALIVQEERMKRRFYLSTGWFFLVQCIQLSWLLTHPFSYIYGLYLFLTVAIGAQFGLLGALASKGRVLSRSGPLFLSGVWTLLEWLRLFFLSGFSFNPIGIALTGSVTALQFGSVAGLYGLSFLVMAANLYLLRAWLLKKRLLAWGAALGVLLLPYLFGLWHLEKHEKKVEESASLSVLLVQTAFPVEEVIPFSSWREWLKYTQEEWHEIFEVLKPHLGSKAELIALPEYVVPFGTYVAIYPFEEVKQDFTEVFGKEAEAKLPELKEPMALNVEGSFFVTNAFICQALSNLFQADLVAGLQDDQWVTPEERRSYSSGFYFWPGGSVGLRYEKQVLLPMAEYIPFEILRTKAKEYGISGSFTCGQGAKVFPGSKASFGLSICYEETYGHLMRENRLKGADLLVNLTSDVWYPNSRLPKQHFDHARLRTVESGIPLVRSCNTGITSAFDSLGRVVAQGGEEEEWERFALLAKVPLYHYRTLYSLWGDALAVGISFALLLFGIRKRKF